MTDLSNIKPEDLQNLDLGDFQKLQDMLAEAEKLRKKQDFEKVCLSVKEIIDNSPFSAEEVLEALSKGKVKKKALPKYQNIEDSSQTWTGRGRKPAWLVEALESGKELESFLIEHEKQESLL